MTSVKTDESRRIVTCDDCGTPYPAVDEGENLRLVGPDDPSCSACGGSTFSRLTL